MTDFIIVTGPITGKARPRFNTQTGTAYNPRTTKRYEALIEWCYKTQHGEYYHEFPVDVTIIVEHSVPKNTPIAQREAMLAGKIEPMKKPDIDNIAKIVLDALNGVAYKDDKQVVELHCYKRYAVEPRLMVNVDRHMVKAERV